MTRHATRQFTGLMQQHVRTTQQHKRTLFLCSFSSSSSSPSSLASSSSSLQNLLFSKDAPSQQVTHGGAVEVGGSQWQASIEIGCLVLRNTIHTDDKKEQAASRFANIKRELEKRQQELEALAADIGRVEAECETVMEGGR